MTREQKLALIVGFSLILLVGVLISDHMSKARDAELAYVPPDRTAPEVAAVESLPNPFERLESPATRTGVAPVLLGTNGTATLAADSQSPAQSEQAALAQATPPAPAVAATEPAPVEIRMAGRPAAEEGLIDAARRAGLELVNNELRLTPAAETTASQPVQPQRPAVRAAEATPSSRDPNAATHNVREGESLFTIAQRYYGDGKLWPKLAEYNASRVGTGGTVRSGVRLDIPSRAFLTGAPEPAQTITPAAVPPRASERPRQAQAPAVRPPAQQPAADVKLVNYTVKRGDTLSSIAQQFLGSSRRWRQLLEYNKGLDADGLQAGMVIKVPAK